MDGIKITLENIDRIPRQMNSGILFLLILRGSIELEHNSETYTMGKNDVVILEHGDLFALSGKKSNVLLLINIFGEYATKNLPNYLNGAIRCNSCNSGPHADRLYTPIKRNIARMAFIHYKQEKGHELLLQSVLFETLHMLARDFSTEASKGQIKNISDERLYSILAYIHQNFKNRISLEDAAAKEFISVQYLSRIFREQLNTTFMEYINSLRIAGAERELVFTTDTVTRIALNNGFASARALNEQFIRKHHCSPAQYRKTYKTTDILNPVGNVRLMDDSSSDSLGAFVKFINSYNLEQNENIHANYLIETAKVISTQLPSFQNIVEIGDIALALRADIRKQLDNVQQQLHMSVVSFGGFFRGIHAAHSDPNFFQTYDLYEALSSFHRLGLVPLIRLETADMDLFENPSTCLKALSEFLNLLQLRYSSAVFGQWRFEIVEDSNTPERYADIYKTIKSVNSDIEIGLRIDLFLSAENKDFLREMTYDAPPDFFGFTFDPNEESRPSDPAEFASLFRKYHTNTLVSVRLCMEYAGYSSTPLYLMSWNTLTGKTPVEAGEFHRTALMADVLCSLMGTIKGAAVQLSLYVNNLSNSNLLTRPLSLYVSKDIRRPMFFVSKAIASLKPQIIWSSENGLLTTDGKDRYALLLYNACYIDPFLALDNIRIQGNALNCSITLSGLTQGRYRIKEYLMDKDKGSLYHNSLKLDLSVPLDEEDWDEYVESISNPSITLWEADIQDGVLLIQQELDINATSLFIIKRFA